MTFLILSDNATFISYITAEIKNREKSSKVYKSDFQEANLKKIKKQIQDISLCFIYSEQEAALTQLSISETSLITGYIISQEVPVITNLSFLSNQTLFTKNDVISLSTKEDFAEYFSKKYKSILNIYKIRSAKKELFARGIPFTPECFGSYIAKNKPEIFNLFISGGMDVNSCDDLGTPMLNIAVRNDHEDIVKYLIDLGADINVSSQDRGYSPVMDAVWKGNTSITELLIKKGANLNTLSKDGQSNLVLAVGADRIPIVKLLVENGADPDVKDQMGMSAYNYATLFRKEKITEILKPYHKE